MKEGGGPKAEQIVPNFFVPIRGEGRGSMNLGQNPQIFLFFSAAKAAQGVQMSVRPSVHSFVRIL